MKKIIDFIKEFSHDYLQIVVLLVGFCLVFYISNLYALNLPKNDDSIKEIKANLRIENKLLKEFFKSQQSGETTLQKLDDFEDYFLGLFSQIQYNIQKNRIAPSKISIRNFDSQGRVYGEARNEAGRKVRIGIFAMSANPAHRGHFEPLFKALAEGLVDKIYIIVAAEDSRKPDLVSEAIRFPLLQFLLKKYPDIFEFSGVAKGTRYDGETNIFRLMEINQDLDAEWVYLLGSDHALYWKQRVSGIILKETESDILVSIIVGQDYSGNPITGEKLFKKNTPEFSMQRSESTKLCRVTILDTIGKLNRNYMQGAYLFESPNDFRAVRGDKHLLSIAFIGRDQAELDRNLGISDKQIKDLGIILNLKLYNIKQDFPFSATEIRNAFNGKSPISDLWAIEVPTLCWIANYVWLQKILGIPKDTWIYQISVGTLQKLQQLELEAIKRNIILLDVLYEDIIIGSNIRGLKELKKSV